MLGLVACNEKINVEKYTVQAPTISSISPTEGEVGTSVTITGTNLTRVNKVTMGEGEMTMLYRVSPTELVAVVSSDSRSGKIGVSNDAGSATSDDSFTIAYYQPVVTAYPDTATVGDQITLRGEHLNAINAVFADGISCQIINSRKNEMTFIVPYHEDEVKIALRFAYFDGTEDKVFGPEGETFVILKIRPTYTTIPTSLTKYTPVSLEGENLDIIDSLFVGTTKLLIKSKNANEIVFDLPTNCFTGPFSGDLYGICYGQARVDIAKDFQVISDPNEPHFYEWNDVVMTAGNVLGLPEMPFFIGGEGLVVSSCEAADYKGAIDFLMYDNNGYCQMYGPQNATKTLKNFKCDGTSIVVNATEWQIFYATTTKFRPLDPANAGYKAVIDAWENGTLVSISDAVNGLAAPSSAAPKFYPSADKAGTNFSPDGISVAWVKNFNTGKNGLLKVKEVLTDPDTKKCYRATFDIIWDK